MRPCPMTTISAWRKENPEHGLSSTEKEENCCWFFLTFLCARIGYKPRSLLRSRRLPHRLAEAAHEHAIGARAALRCRLRRGARVASGVPPEPLSPLAHPHALSAALPPSH